MINKKKLVAASLSMLFFSCFQSVFGSEITLQVVRFPERRTVEVPMRPTGKIPGASMKAKMEFREGQARLEMSYDNMKPAVLFGGDITCYVLWAVNRDGGTENLGELWVRPERDKDTLQFSTGLRTFALLVTAEPYFQVERPSEFFIFLNDRSSDRQAPSSNLTFSGFGPRPTAGYEDLATVRYDGKIPLDLVQAERVFELAGEMKADQYAPAIYQEAALTLRQAQAMGRTSRVPRGTQEFARKSVASSNEAIKVTLRMQQAEALERRIEERRQQVEELENRAQESEQRAGQLEKEKAEAERAIAASKQELASLTRERSQLAAEKDRVIAERDQVEAARQTLIGEVKGLQNQQAELTASLDRLRQERDALQNRLEGALSQVAETRESARGFIVNLPDILFDVNQAQLKPEAQRVLAKLSGILLILPDLSLEIEGHTDSTGLASHNLRLSQQRADAVFDLLAREGIETTRMVARGYGFDRPVADNSTPEGRSRNRRVEIIIGSTPRS